MKATYYDYGQVQDFEAGLKYEFFREKLRENMITLETGENEYHEPSSTHDMDFDALWSVVTEGRLRVKTSGCGNKGIPICVVMIREDVWKAMLHLENPNKRFENLGDGKYRYHNVTADTYKTEITKAVESCLSDVTFKDCPTRMRFSLNEAMAKLHLDAPMDFSYHNSGVIAKLIERIETGKTTLDSPDSQDVIQSLAELQYVMEMFDTLRKTWHPGTGQGSQSQEYEATAQYHHAMAMIGYRVANMRYRDWEEPREAQELDPEVFMRKIFP
jgi:hypothetical protein